MRCGYAFMGVGLAIVKWPVLVHVSWKLIWIAAVGLPHLVSGDLDAATSDVLFNCSFVVIILAVIPWRYVWSHYTRAPADAWR